METYTASLDAISKIMTGFIFLLFLFGIGVMLTLNPWYGGLLVTVISIIILVPTYLYSITSYQITDEKLIIKRPFSKFDKEIPLAEIESASLLSKEDFKWTIRTFGNGGLFGYTGYYANTKLGSFQMYATNRKNRILIILKNAKGKIVISPDDAGMADALQKHLKRSA